MERRLNPTDVILLRQRAASQRVRVALRLAGTTYDEVACRVGVSETHLGAAARGQQRLSLRAKLRVARLLRVPAAVLWPELETIALEVLHGAGGRG